MIWFYSSYHTSHQGSHPAHFRARKMASEVLAKGPTSLGLVQCNREMMLRDGVC